MANTFLCPTCGLNKNGGPINLQAGPAGSGAPVLFTGCGDCLIKIVAQHKIMLQGETCFLCGETKVPIMFDGGTRMTCPLHANAKRLLAKALQALDPEHAAAMEIKELLGVRG